MSVSGPGGAGELRARSATAIAGLGGVGDGSGGGRADVVGHVQTLSDGGKPNATAAAGSSSRASGGSGAQTTSVAGRVLLGVSSTLLWMLFSSMLIILNKSLYKRGFGYPSTVTGMGQLFSAASGLVLAGLRLQPLRPPPSLSRVFLPKLLPIVAYSAATMYFGNAAYLHLSVSFIQILKAFTPALTLLLCVAAGLERPHWPLAVSVLLIAGGTAVAVLVESGAPSFHFLGFLYFMASSITEAARVVGAEVLQSSDKYNTAESLLYIGGPTAVVLLAVGAVLEGPTMVASGGPAMFAADPLAFISAFAMSALVNMSCFFAIQTTSSLTFKVAGCVKNVAVVGYGLAVHGERVTGVQMAGYAISVAGFTLYSKLKMAASAAASPAGKRKSA